MNVEKKSEKIVKKKYWAGFADLDAKAYFTVHCPGLIIWAEEQKSLKNEM